MERENPRSKKGTTRVQSIIFLITGMLLLLTSIIGCTNSLFIVKGSRNKVNQEAKQTTDTKIDSITINFDAK